MPQLDKDLFFYIEVQKFKVKEYFVSHKDFNSAAGEKLYASRLRKKQNVFLSVNPFL